MSVTRILGTALAVAMGFGTALAHERPDEVERDANGCRVVHGGDGVAGAAASSSRGSTASVGTSVAVGSSTRSSSSGVHVGGGGVSVSAGNGSVSSTIGSSSGGGVSISAGDGEVSGRSNNGRASAPGTDCVVVVPGNSQE